MSDRQHSTPFTYYEIKYVINKINIFQQIEHYDSLMIIN